jgi:hypothetical protein
VYGQGKLAGTAMVQTIVRMTCSSLHPVSLLDAVDLAIGVEMHDNVKFLWAPIVSPGCPFSVCRLSTMLKHRVTIIANTDNVRTATE